MHNAKAFSNRTFQKAQKGLLPVHRRHYSFPAAFTDSEQAESQPCLTNKATAGSLEDQGKFSGQESSVAVPLLSVACCSLSLSLPQLLLRANSSAPCVQLT